jgi:hypothetical protein
MGVLVTLAGKAHFGAGVDGLASEGRACGEARKYFFFEKKKQKTFVRLANVAYTTGLSCRTKSFLVLFSKKNRVLRACLPLANG